MRRQHDAKLAWAAATTLAGGAAAAAADAPAVDPAAVDKAFETLKTYDWGTDRDTMKPIDEAVLAVLGDEAARKELAARLTAVLKTDASRSAKDFVCRKLTVVGTADSVPALAALLTDKDLSHMARYALERIQAPEAAAAMRDALSKVNGELKAGIIGSLGVRRDADSVDALAAALGDSDKAVVRAAACALGNIGTAKAARALMDAARKASGDVKTAAVDGCFVCAELLLADGNKREATAIYKSLSGEDQPKHVRLAATRGLLDVAGKKD